MKYGGQGDGFVVPCPFQTPSTTYTFTYGNFSLRSAVKIGSRTLASYTYESGTNRLQRLDYGNGDRVQYIYDSQGRLIAEEDRGRFSVLTKNKIGQRNEDTEPSPVLGISPFSNSIIVLGVNTMKFFKKELWAKINDSDELIRKQAEIEWEKNCESYQQHFLKVKKHLPDNFINNFLLRNGLHDYIIENISISKTTREYCCDLQLSNNTETILITMYGIKALQVDIASFQNCIQGKLTFGYCEFEITLKHNIRLSILCDIKNELQIECETISFKKVD